MARTTKIYRPDDIIDLLANVLEIEGSKKRSLRIKDDPKAKHALFRTKEDQTLLDKISIELAGKALKIDENRMITFEANNEFNPIANQLRLFIKMIDLEESQYKDKESVNTISDYKATLIAIEIFLLIQRTKLISVNEIIVWYKEDWNDDCTIQENLIKLLKEKITRVCELTSIPKGDIESITNKIYKIKSNNSIPIIKQIELDFKYLDLSRIKESDLTSAKVALQSLYDYMRFCFILLRLYRKIKKENFQYCINIIIDKIYNIVFINNQQDVTNYIYKLDVNIFFGIVERYTKL